MTIDTTRAAGALRGVCILGLLAMAVLLAGCDEATTEHTNVVPVAGRLLVNGLPASGAKVVFHPTVAQGEGHPITSRATADNDGHYQLTTFATDDGAPAGDYVVTVYWPAAAPNDDMDESVLPPDKLHGRFAIDDASILRAQVGEAPTTFAAVDLASESLQGASEFQFEPKE